MWMTNREFVKATTNMTDLLVPMKFTREESVKMAQETVKLAGALSEWTWGQYSSAEASDILTKAMLGEVEQLKAMGIKIDQSSKQFNERIKVMMRDKNLTLDQAKALDIQRQIMEKSTDAQAAFAAWWDSLTRKQAALGAKLRDVKETLAVALIPIFHEAIKVLSPLIEDFSKWVTELSQNEEAMNRLKTVMSWMIQVLWFLAKTIWTAVEWWAMLFEVVSNYLTENEEAFKQYWEAVLLVWEDMKAWLDIIFTWISENIDSVFSFASEKLEQMKNILNWIIWVWKSISWAVTKYSPWALWERVWKAIVSWFREKWWPVAAWESYVVGEKWPEMFVPKSNWTIVPNGKTWWNVTINMWWVMVSNEADENRLVRKIKDSITRDAQLYNLWIN